MPLEAFQGVRTPATTSTDQEKSTVRNLWYNENLEGRCVFRHGPRRPLLDWALGKPNKIVPPLLCVWAVASVGQGVEVLKQKEECNFLIVLRPLVVVLVSVPPCFCLFSWEGICFFSPFFSFLLSFFRLLRQISCPARESAYMEDD